MSKVQKFNDWIAVAKNAMPISDEMIACEVMEMVRKGGVSLDQAGAAITAICYADHVTTELQAEIAQLRAKLAELEAENQKLGAVANMAAVCMIDLNCNMKEAYKECMAGDIPHGAYRHVLDRHGSLLATLADAGFTEKHRIYDFPIKPQPAKTGAA